MAALASSVSVPAGASEPRSLTEPSVLSQPAAVVDVADAFADGAGMDFRVSLGYRQTWRRSTLRREARATGSDGELRPGVAFVKVASFAESVNRLDVRSELGLYRDLALVLRVPIVLSRERELSSSAANAAGLLDGAPGQPLFSLPFQAPNRSGVEYLGVGVNWGILSQRRDAGLPNLVVGVEGRFAVSEPMHACGRGLEVPCADPGDVNRDGSVGPLLEGRYDRVGAEPVASRPKPGVARGTTGLRLHAATSRRHGPLEPYAGFDVMLEFDNEGSGFGDSAFWNDGPPWRGSVRLGAEILPWEVVEHFQRFSLDLSIRGQFVSAGRDYSELYDALGSSSATSFRQGSYSGFSENPDADTADAYPSVVDPDSARVFPTGITRVGAHGSGELSLTARWQAGRYVRFDLGGALSLTQPHFVTGGEPCDEDRAVSEELAGPCASRGAASASAPSPDPSYRPEIDAPGQRFFVDTSRAIDAWMSATVMF